MIFPWQRIVPRNLDTGGGGGGEGGDPAASPGGDAAPQHQRPEWLTDERFWDSSSGQVRSEDLHKSYRELQSAFGKRVHDLSPEARKALTQHIPEDMRSAWSEELKAQLAADEEFISLLLEARLPKAPEAYEIVAEAVPEGIEIDKDAEGYQAFEGLAKKHALSNEAFNDLLAIGAQMLAPARPLEERAAEFGESYTPDRAKAVVTAARNLVGNDRAGLDILLGRVMEPAEFKALETLVKAAGEKPTPNPNGSAAPAEMTQQEIDDLIGSPDYRSNPDKQRAVSAWYQRRHGNVI